MSEVRPLHVRVAEALGCNPIDRGWGPGMPRWSCSCKDRAHVKPGWTSEDPLLKPYDTDWNIVGPLIEKYSIDLEHVCDAVRASVLVDSAIGGYCLTREGKDSLTAVCYLLLALKEAGKL